MKNSEGGAVIAFKNQYAKNVKAGELAYASLKTGMVHRYYRERDSRGKWVLRPLVGVFAESQSEYQSEVKVVLL